MADPFEVLRVPVEAVRPDPGFSQRLRARIERALTLPKGVTVSDLDLDIERDLDPDLGFDPAAAPATSSAAPAASQIRHAEITPYLAIAGAADAIEWYATAFGATKRGEPIMMPDGRVGHAEIEIGGALLMLADEFPEVGHVGPPPGGGVAVTLHLAVPDVDAVIARAVAAGAQLRGAPTDFEYGRHGSITDPFGHRWMIFQYPQQSEGTSRAVSKRHGDIGFVSLSVPSVNRADRFFSRVLGWRYEPGSTPQSRRVQGLSLHHGIFGGQERSTLFCCFAVRDVAEAVEAVKRAGGTASEPYTRPYGTVSDCSDDQGVEFAVYEPPEGVLPDGAASADAAGEDAAARDASHQGDLAYVTMEVRDSAKTRSFYGAVLGWTYHAGNVEDGWQVEGTSPMVGLAGGHRVATTVPMYRVDEIVSAVARVREAGGAATEPETYPYGITSDCSDDQGTRFYLGQLYE
jgi:uncharacterized glyoxalase superfamily protein PhnB/catechol 2,3-dioxygenase-like lactoylglutathione lyase family enzyme